jgi:alginate O-acetyltransferase complex protein AlgI
MAFNSFQFLFVFLPISLVVFLILRHQFCGKVSLWWLAFVSIVFYSWSHPQFLFILSGSILVNYGIARWMISRQGVSKRVLLGTGIAINIGVLCAYKYYAFLFNTIVWLTGAGDTVGQSLLPLGISFITFQQIIFLVDRYKTDDKTSPFMDYIGYVTFFPHLLSGPIVRYNELVPQFKLRDKMASIDMQNLAVGLSIFAMGLAKKTLIADKLSVISNVIFVGASNGPIDFTSGWIAALSFTFQLYFDFSGYSDMAIGVARMFGIILPVNFLSPYKADSVVDFWRRWHITLSRFLRDYIYIPLGGNRKGTVRQYYNLLITMLLGGLWHGAGWTFVFWGFLHGAYLCVNHLWFGLQKRLGYSPTAGGSLRRLLSWSFTFLAVVVAWVFFKADSFATAINILSGMFGTHGISIPSSMIHALHLEGYSFISILLPIKGGTFFTVALICLCFVIVLFGRNVVDIFAPFKPVFEDAEKLSKDASCKKWWQWKPVLVWMIVTALLLYFSIVEILGQKSSDFIYFNF